MEKVEATNEKARIQTAKGAVVAAIIILVVSEMKEASELALKLFEWTAWYDSKPCWISSSKTKKAVVEEVETGNSDR